MHTSKDIIGDELDLQWDEIVERWKQEAADCPSEVWENAVAGLRNEMRTQVSSQLELGEAY